ncbi:MAG: cell envelope integrity protein TolA [Gammaproteobacteria bacterium]|nr:cell envelope integrity protein TolA [Gammaproteobacteria bacterium]
MATRAGKFGLTAKSLFLALVIHGLVLMLMMVHFSRDSGAIAQSAPESVPIQAMVVDESDVEQHLAELKAEDESKKQQALEARQKLEEAKKLREQEQEKLAELEKRRKQEEQKIAEAEKKRKTEQAKVLEAEKKRKEEQAKVLAEEKKRKEDQQKAEAEKKRLAEQKRREEEEEKKRKEEELRLVKLEKEQEEKRKAEEVARKAAEEKRRQEEELQEKLAEERLRGRAQSALAALIPAIQQAVSRNWIRPPDSESNLEAKVLVTVSPSGEVLEAKVTSSSGDPIFDRSVEAAVLKASPLPIPRDQELYGFFRQFIFRFKPDAPLIS